MARRIQNNEAFHRCLGNVRTADGKQQNILGTIKLEISFNNQNKIIEFLVVPSIQHDIICGIDFWKTFRLKIFINEISEVDCAETGSDPDKLKLTKEQQERLNKVIAAFSNSEIEGLGCTTLLKHYIDTGNAKPIKQRYYPISPAVEKQLSGEIERMLSLGVIEEAPSSPWSSPTVVVVKPGKVRMCVDSRKLNSVTVKDAYPIPNIDGLIARLPPVYCISKIDLKDAFWHRNTLCRLIDMVIPYHLKTHVFVYLDDLLIVSRNFEEHLTHLLEVETLLRKAGLTINVKKNSFGLNKVKYLGFVIGNGNLQVDDEKVNAIRDFPIPKSMKHLRRFLGMTGWYSRFIQNYSDLTFPLTELFSKKEIICLVR